MKEILDLYLAFLRIGFVNFGGGYAMLPLLEKDLVTKRDQAYLMDTNALKRLMKDAESTAFNF